MNRTLLQAQSLYADMGKAERRVADWLLSHPGEVLPFAFRELATACDTSEATIVRFSKRLGLSGYQELKISLASESGGSAVSTHITADDTAYEIYEKVCNDIYCSLEKTKKSLKADSLAEAAQALCDANKIVTFGLGNSASVALDASHKLLRAGLNAVAYSDNHMQMIAASHLSKNDVVIAISHSGSSKDIIEALQIAKSHGATTIAITNSGKSPILRHADIVLATSADETQYNILALNSRIAQLAIIDALYFYIVCNRSEEALESIKETEHSLLSKKY